MSGPSGRHDETPMHELTAEEKQMRELMGFSSFHTTKGNLHYDVWGATCTQGKKREDLPDYEEFQKWVEKKKEIRYEERRKEWDERRASFRRDNDDFRNRGGRGRDRGRDGRSDRDRDDYSRSSRRDSPHDDRRYRSSSRHERGSDSYHGSRYYDHRDRDGGRDRDRSRERDKSRERDRSRDRDRGSRDQRYRERNGYDSGQDDYSPNNRRGSTSEDKYPTRELPYHRSPSPETSYRRRSPSPQTSYRSRTPPRRSPSPRDTYRRSPSPAEDRRYYTY
ncbi:uncharacterized protein [Panulirus ornatus]